MSNRTIVTVVLIGVLIVLINVLILMNTDSGYLTGWSVGWGMCCVYDLLMNTHRYK